MGEPLRRGEGCAVGGACSTASAPTSTLCRAIGRPRSSVKERRPPTTGAGNVSAAIFILLNARRPEMQREPGAFVVAGNRQ